MTHNDKEEKLKTAPLNKKYTNRWRFGKNAEGIRKKEEKALRAHNNYVFPVTGHFATRLQNF